MEIEIFENHETIFEISMHVRPPVPNLPYC